MEINKRVIIVSNRLPVKIKEQDGEMTYHTSEGGLATGLTSIYKQNNNLWIGWPGGIVEESVKEKVSEDLQQQNLLPIFLTQQEINEFYEGFSNETIWPLFHYFPTYTTYNPQYWESYKAVNQKYADAILKVASKDDVIWIHDYQLMLVPQMVRNVLPDVSIGFFQHIPFPSYEIFRILPWRKELLQGVLGADVLGFHTYDDVRHFLSATTRILNIEGMANELTIGNRKVAVDAFPISIDYKKYRQIAEDNITKRNERKLKQLINHNKLVISIDRLDYSKGIIHRLRAYELFLQKHPELRGKVTMIQLVVPSRDNVAQYKELKEEMNRMVSEINGQRELVATQGSNHIEFTGLERSLRLTSNVSLNNILNGQHFVLNEPKYLVLTYGLPLEAPLLTTAEDFLMRTVSYWRHWIKNTGIGNMYQKQVIRSSLALKIHQYEDTGAIIAASTTSLPEFDGSGRTWDYRYCWLRDAYYILNAFNNIGHFEEGEQYFHFIANVAVKEDGRYNPLYKITGTADFVETIVDLDGYKGNKPVRIGNQAVEHIQNDTYGQVLLSLLPLYTDRRFIFEERHDSSKWISDILEKIEHTIDEPDAGIWEFRHFTQEHCYTNLFQWAGCMAAMKMARHIGDERLLARAHDLREKAKKKIEACYDPERKVYTQAIGTKNLDASTLQLIMMHYLNPKSQRARDHLAAVEAELKADHGLFYRYLHKDDFGKPKTTFLITAFWYVEALACVGRVKEAIEHFNSLMKFTNHLGLLSEDVDSSDGSQWGNFPQAYSHVGLMNAAYRISKKLDRPGFL